FCLTPRRPPTSTPLPYTTLFRSHEQVEPGQIPTLFNPVASYRRSFTLERPLDDGETVSIVFEGAESAIAVWCNGVYIGYATDSLDRKSTRLNSSHVKISYAVFCL